MVHTLLEWLAEAEQTLRFHGALPDDEDALRTLIEQHKVSSFQYKTENRTGREKPVTVRSECESCLSWFGLVFLPEKKSTIRYTLECLPPPCLHTCAHAPTHLDRQLCF